MIATLATLQTGIEPGVLALLTENHAAAPQEFGWIVSLGQVGMAVGALLGWLQTCATHRLVRGAPIVALAASIALPFCHDLAAVLALRLVLGTCMGLLLTRAVAIAARRRPHQAIGIIMLAQQLLSTAALAALPLVATLCGPAAALAMLALAPLTIALLLRHEAVGDRDAETTGQSARDVPLVSSAMTATIVTRIVPMVLLVGITMMLWSYIAPIGTALNLPDADIGSAIALTSLASAPSAMLAALTMPRFKPWLTVLMCGSGILSPLLLSADAGINGYLVALTLFNMGSTFGMIRLSAHAMQNVAAGRERRLVAMAQCAAMAGGPALGAVAVRVNGLAMLDGAAIAGVAAAILLPAIMRIAWRATGLRNAVSG
ncbi:MFS transporter [Sphingomonas bacterium]|uniref:MFS transporter n=1 Tax=Sphingomonas bacterium TaxID=1895847 RepID=UPI001576FC25|nr:MFS transporter [Sphingomonas bacterium]